MLTLDSEKVLSPYANGTKIKPNKNMIEFKITVHLIRIALKFQQKN